jgi:hypothetical protein
MKKVFRLTRNTFLDFTGVDLWLHVAAVTLAIERIYSSARPPALLTFESEGAERDQK